MELLSIGTIIEVKGNQFCIIGYTSIPTEKEVECGYYVVPYPLGYINFEKLFFIPVSADMTVIAQGYATRDSGKVLKLLGMHFDMAQKIPYEEYPKVVEKYKQLVNAVKQGEKK